MKALVTVLGGVAEVQGGEVEIIDFDDWNDQDTSDLTRQLMIERVQAAGYRCVVSEDGSSVPSIMIFTPEAPYDQYINKLDDSSKFTVYDPKED